jgi:catechol 2,3-dioxygenase-like lactoylglutathione lyase family enzyme
MNITGTRHVLAVKNLAKSSEYYKEKLGCRSVWETEGWQFLIRDNFRVMLGECPSEMQAHETGDHSYFAYIDVTGIDALYAEFKARGVEIPSEIEDKPWQQREFSVRTPDGHRIAFGESIDDINVSSKE